MTDKQIIIDGIDVSGCPCIQSNNIGDVVCVRLARTSLYCEGQPCYYKALERKEQECDQLKAEVKSKTEYIQEQREIINQYSKEIEMYKKCQGKRASKREEELKAENDQLKRQHQADKGLITSTGKMNYQLVQEYDKLKTENKRLKETFDSLFKVQYKLADNNKKLRQCLTKIKDLCQKHIKAEKIVMANDILQKISECEGNDGK